MSETKSVSVDAMSGTDGAQLCISKFTDNFNTVRFRIDSELSEYTLMIVTEAEGVPMVFEADGTRLYTEYNKSTGQTFLVWHLGREVTCTDGLVVYQIVAYKTENDEIVSTWYSREGRIIVTDSIDTTPYSTALIGSYPNLVTRLILETDKIRSYAGSLEESKVDKVEGKGLSENDFTDSHLEKLSGIESGAEVNLIEEIKVDGVGVEINEADRSVNIELEERFDEKVDRIENNDTVHLIYAETNSGKTIGLRNTRGASPKSVPQRGESSELLIRTNPTLDNEAVPKKYVDDNLKKKVDNEAGKVLSSNDFSDAYKKKLDGIEEGATDNVFMLTGTGTKEYDAANWEYIETDGDFADILEAHNAGKQCVVRCDGTDYILAHVYDNNIVFFSNVWNIVLNFMVLYWRNDNVVVKKSFMYQISSENTNYKLDEFTKRYYTSTNYYLSAKAVYDFVRPKPETEINGSLETNKSYNLGVVGDALSLTFPSDATDGDVIYLTFETGDTAINLSVDTTNTSDIDIYIEADTGYEIFGKFNGRIWIVNYSEYTFTPTTNIEDDLPSVVGPEE